jgi:outer membrane protein OmpA-like peptidoglycan-associated protein
LLVPTFLLRAEDAAKASTGANDEMSVASSALPAAPMPEGSMAAMPYMAGRNLGTPRFELFMGYSYLRAMPELAAGNRLVYLNGGSTSIAFNLNRYLGLVGDFGGFNDTRLLLTGAGENPSVNAQVDEGTVFSYLGGPRLSFRDHGRLTPFVQALFGGMHASDITLSGCTGNCTFLRAENTFAMTAGGGLDIRVSHHFAVRIVQAEYVMTRFENLNTGSKASQNDMRLSSGIVFRFGGRGAPPLPPLPPLSYSCSVNPSAVFPGDAIAASGTALNLNPARTAVYTWSADGGTVSGTTSTATIDTTNLAVGAYTLKGHVSESDKPGENADCTASYTVKAYEPPTVACSASPATVISGDSSTITASGVSPQNRPLTYSYSSSSGSVSGTGSTATLSTAGAALGPVTVTCNVVDDKAQAASGTTSVMVEALPVAPKPITSALCSINFERDVRRPARVDNEAKACLDQVALSLQQSADSKVAIVGNASSEEKGGRKIASERAVNTRAYLVSEKGIDSSRLVLYTGSLNGNTVSSTLIPSGATFDATDVTPVNETPVKPHRATPARHNPK